MKLLKGILGLMGAGALALAALPAYSAPIPPPPPVDSLFVYNAAGTVVASASWPDDGAEDFNDPKYADDSSANQALAVRGQYVVYLEPGGNINNRSTWSDVVGVTGHDNGKGIQNTFTFLSDPFDTSDAGLALLGFTTQLGFAFEAAGTIEITAPFGNQWVNQTKYPGGRAFFSSDVPDAGTSMALLGLALAGLGIARRKLA